MLPTDKKCLCAQSNGEKKRICQEAWRRVLGVSKDSVNKALKSFFEGLDKVADHRSGGHARCAAHLVFCCCWSRRDSHMPVSLCRPWRDLHPVRGYATVALVQYYRFKSSNFVHVLGHFAGGGTRQPTRRFRGCRTSLTLLATSHLLATVWKRRGTYPPSTRRRTCSRSSRGGAGLTPRGQLRSARTTSANSGRSTSLVSRSRRRTGSADVQGAYALLVLVAPRQAQAF
jgi:hypothetical protein